MSELPVRTSHFATFADAVWEANFRAAVTRRRYRVWYESWYGAWSIRESYEPVRTLPVGGVRR